MAQHWYDKAKEIAHRKGITYQQIADRLGVEKATVGHWMVGRNQARIDQIRKIAMALDTTLTELVNDDPCYVEDSTERRILETIRELPAEYRAQAETMLRAFAASIPDGTRNDD